MKHQVTRELFAYWDGLRGGRSAPERSDIDPAEIHQILGDTFILEYENENKLNIRLAGTRLCGSFCRELKGRNFLDLWNAQDLSSIKIMVAAVADDEAAAVIGFSGMTERGQSLDFESIILPLRHFGQPRSRILGAASPAETPYWIGIWPLTELHVTSMRLIWPEERPSFMRNHDVGIATRTGLTPQRVAINPDPSRPIFSSERRVGHLTVIEGGRRD